MKYLSFIFVIFCQSALIAQKPCEANFSVADHCFEQIVSLVSTSNSSDGSSITRYDWQLDGASINSNSSFNYLFPVLGTQTLSLIIETGNGCVDTIDQTFTVHPKPEVSFTVDDGCEGEELMFINTSTITSGNVNTNTWVFGDGSNGFQENETHSYSVPTEYTVSLIQISDRGCVGVGVSTVEVFNNPAANFDNPNVCEGETGILLDLSNSTSGLANYEWSLEGVVDPTFGDLNYTFDHPGSVPVQLKVTDYNACVDSITKLVEVLQTPVVDFVGDEVCENQSIILQGSATTQYPTSYFYRWNVDGRLFSSQNANVIFPFSGTYPVQLTVSTADGCVGDTIKNVTVFDSPELAFTADTACFGDSTNFINNSSVSDGTITNFAWDFSGQGSSIETNPKFKFSAPSSYSVVLSVRSSLGCKSIISKRVQVNASPVADFNPVLLCLGQEALIENESSAESGISIVGNSWSVNGIVRSQTNDFRYQPLVPSESIIQLEVEANNGCISSKVDTILVHETPEVDFSIAPICLTDTVSFVSDVRINQGSISSLNWNFGDARTSSHSIVNHVYNSAGSFDVSLMATSDEGCSNQLTQQQMVYDLPEVRMSVSDVCMNDSTLLIDLSYVSDGSNLERNWLYDGAVISEDSLAYFKPNSIGTHEVKLIATSNRGCEDSTSRSIEVFPLPDLSFTVSDTAGCLPLCVNVSNQFSISSGSVAYYEYRMENGSVFQNQEPVHCFEKEGEYTPFVRVITDKGCSSEKYSDQTIEVYPNALAEMNLDEDEFEVFDATLTAISSSLNYESLIWDLGNGDSLEGEQIEYTYSDTGDFSVRLIAKNENGCSDTTFKNVRVNPLYRHSIPTAFSPNGDGINDFFKPEVYGAEEYKVNIYARNGNLLFTSEMPDEEWDGNVMNNGKIVPSGVYVVELSIRDVFGSEHYEITNLLLIR